MKGKAFLLQGSSLCILCSGTTFRIYCARVSECKPLRPLSFILWEKTGSKSFFVVSQSLADVCHWIFCAHASEIFFTIRMVA